MVPRKVQCSGLPTICNMMHSLDWGHHAWSQWSPTFTNSQHRRQVVSSGLVHTSFGDILVERECIWWISIDLKCPQQLSLWCCSRYSWGLKCSKTTFAKLCTTSHFCGAAEQLELPCFLGCPTTVEMSTAKCYCGLFLRTQIHENDLCGNENSSRRDGCRLRWRTGRGPGDIHCWIPVQCWSVSHTGGTPSITSEPAMRPEWRVAKWTSFQTLNVFWFSFSQSKGLFFKVWQAFTCIHS